MHLKHRNRSTLALTLPHNAVFGADAGERQVAILNGIGGFIESMFKDYNVVFHVFSNGGAFCLRWLSVLTQNNDDDSAFLHGKRFIKKVSALMQY